MEFKVMKNEVVMIGDDSTSVKEEVENTFTSVVDCHIWINEESQANRQSSLTEDSKNWLQNELLTGNDLKDPLGLDNECKSWKKNNPYVKVGSLEDPLCDNENTKLAKNELAQDFQDSHSKIYGSESICPFIDLTNDECGSTGSDMAGNGSKEAVQIYTTPISNCHQSPKKEEVVIFKTSRYEYSADPVVNLTRDALTILDTDVKVFQCPHCEYRNDKPGRVSSHIKTKHIRQRRFACAHCDYKATQKGTLEGHIRAKHTKERPYKCMYCSYRAVQASSLLQHIRARHLR